MIYVFGDCELDTGCAELRRGGVGRHVEPQVFDVLRFLVEHRSRLVSKEELLDTIWGHRYVSSGTLNSRIKSARQAIGDDGSSQRMIRTVRGRGFRFVSTVEMREGHSEVAAGHVPSAPASIQGPTSERAPEPIARARELATLQELLESASDGHRRFAFISGESGIGKSTLAEAFLARVPGEVRVARGQCLEQHGAGEAYLPLLDALGRLCRDPAGEEVIALLERFSPTWIVQMPSLIPPERFEEARRRALGATRERMLREVVEALEALARDTPLVVVLEDLHWSDPSTIDAILWLCQHQESTRLLLVGTFRPSEAEPYLRAALGQAKRSGRCREIPLSPWSEEDLEAYCAVRYPAGSMPREVLALAHRRTDGNPLFVQTLLDAWMETGALRLVDGGWRSGDTLQNLAADIPGSLRMLLDQTIARLSDRDREILYAGSVVGSRFASALAAAATELDVEEVDARCHALARRGHILQLAGSAEWPDGTLATRFSFTHHLVRDAIYDEIPLTRRTRLHREVGERLERAHGAAPAEHCIELAHHFRMGRDDERAVRYLKLAAEQAVSRSAYREAVGHLMAAIEILGRRPDLPDAPRLELTLQRMLGSALLVARGWGDPDAVRAYARARELSERLDDPGQLARVLYGLAYLHEIRGEYRRAERLLKERLSLAPPSQRPQDVLETHELLSCSLFHQGDFRGALENANRARELVDRSWNDPFLASLGDNAGVACHYWAALALWFLGFPDQALQPARTALEMATGSELIYMQAAAEWQMARIRLFRRERPLAAEHADRARLVAERQGYPYPLALALAVCGHIRALEGDVEGGLEEISRGIEMQEGMGAHMEVPYCYGLLAEAHLAADRTSDGLAATERAFATITRGSRTFFWDAELLRIRGELLLRDGRTAEAETSLRDALATAERQNAHSLALRAAMSLYRLGQAGEARDDVRSLVDRLRDRFSEGMETPDLVEAQALAGVGGGTTRPA